MNYEWEWLSVKAPEEQGLQKCHVRITQKKNMTAIKLVNTEEHLVCLNSRRPALGLGSVTYNLSAEELPSDSRKRTASFHLACSACHSSSCQPNRMPIKLLKTSKQNMSATSSEIHRWWNKMEVKDHSYHTCIQGIKAQQKNTFAGSQPRDNGNWEASTPFLVQPTQACMF